MNMYLSLVLEMYYWIIVWDLQSTRTKLIMNMKDTTFEIII